MAMNPLQLNEPTTPTTDPAPQPEPVTPTPPVEPQPDPVAPVEPAAPVEPTPEPSAAPPVEPAAPPVEPAAPVVPTVSSLREEAVDRGFDVSGFETEADLERFLWDTVVKQQSDQQFAELGRQVAPDHDKWLAYKQQQQAPSPAPGPSAVPESTPGPAGLEWELPDDIDPRYESLLELDPATGLYRGSEGMPNLVPIADQRNKYVMAQKQQAQRLMTDFPDLVNQVSDPKFKALEAKITAIEQANVQYVQQQQLASLANQYEKDFFVAGDNGQFAIDPRTNQFVTTPFYEATVHFSERNRARNPNASDGEIMQWSVEDARMAEKAGMLTPQASPSPTLAPVAPPAAPATPAAVGEQQRMTFMQEARGDHQANRDGYSPDPSAPLGPGQRPPSMEDLTIPEVKKLGLNSR